MSEVVYLKSKEVAELVGFKIDHFRKEIKHAPDFPKPVQIKLANGGLSRPRWKKQDIENYLNKIAA